jgi:hypothetical protein
MVNVVGSSRYSNFWCVKMLLKYLVRTQLQGATREINDGKADSRSSIYPVCTLSRNFRKKPLKILACIHRVFVVFTDTIVYANAMTRVSLFALVLRFPYLHLYSQYRKSFLF